MKLLDPFSLLELGVPAEVNLMSEYVYWYGTGFTGGCRTAAVTWYSSL